MARALVDTEQGKRVEIFGSRKVVKRCKIMCTNEFSGHAKADQLIELYKKFDNCKSIILNHGDTEEKEALMDRIIKETEVKKVGILGKSGYRVDAYGIEKEIPNELYM
jgi:Cft2 family RNA processing exonuclease